MCTQSAVLLIIFNRPALTRRVFERIREARPPRLYIAADGPREDRPGEERLTGETRSVIGGIDWPCEVITLFRENNLGCRNAVSGAISWFFRSETEGIILEDDCLPVLSFFSFCDDLLQKFRDDEEVAQISGSNFIGAAPAGGASYFFSHYPDIWGWATWRRSWYWNDTSMRDWPATRKAKIAKVVNGGLLANLFWSKHFERTWSGEIDTWDYQWLFSVWQRRALSVVPRENQIENLGYGTDATHTTNTRPSYVFAAKEIQFPLTHPTDKKPPMRADKEISRRRYQITVLGFLATLAISIRPLRELAKVSKGFFRSRPTS